MKPFTPISRRRFLSHAGMTALAAKASSLPRPASSTPTFACATSDQELHLYTTQGIAWTRIQTIPSEAPISLVSDVRHETLHVLHAVSEYHGLPYGYIESFHIDKQNGHLKSFATQPLSLSAIDPSHMALSPDDKMLAVAVRGGSAYNLLPVRNDGSIGRPIAIRKEISLDDRSHSRPIHVAFDSTGSHIFALDQGNAELSVFSAQPGFSVLSRLSLPRDSHLAHATYHADKHLLFVVDQSSGSLLTIRHNQANNELSLVSQNVTEDFRGPLALDTTSQTLFTATADSVSLYCVQSEVTELQPMQRISYPLPNMGVHSITLDIRNHALYLAAQRGVFRSKADAWHSNFSPFERVALASQIIAFL